MQRGSRRRSASALGVIPLVGIIAACAPGNIAPAASRRSTAPEAASTAIASSAAPIILIEQQQGTDTVLQATDSAGAPLWATPSHGDVVSVAGSRIYSVDYTSNQISVSDSSGHPIGTGDLPKGGAVVFSPVGAEWAWSAIDSTVPSPAPTGSTVEVRGSLWVAGVNEAPRRVYQWSETGQSALAGGPFNGLIEWSDQGLVSSSLPAQSCGGWQESASYIVDPATGTKTVLATDGRAVADVHGGLVAAFAKGSRETIVVSGRASFSWTNTPASPHELVEPPSISPDGDVVMVPLVDTECGGIPTVRTAFVKVATHAATYVQGVYGRFWVDDSHAIGWTSGGAGQNQELDLIGSDGSRAQFTHGDVMGVLR
ncbi:MAG: hypothetical protein ACREN2_00425 [Candidatus Dormibacteria bacterium]